MVRGFYTQPEGDTMSDPQELNQGYQSVLEIFEKEGAVIEAVYLTGGRLRLRATAVSEASRMRIWNALRFVEPVYPNVDPEISVRCGEQTYIVRPGDNLSTISQHFFGDVNHRSQIAMANSSVDPDRILVGQRLKIPCV
jgi:nucleoid-associated protein YgaU